MTRSSDENNAGTGLDSILGRMLHREEGEPHPLEVWERPGGLRALHFGSQPTQSLLDPEQPHRLCLPYQQAMMSARLFLPEPKQAWLLGLGGGALAHHLRHHLPGSSLAAVDYDPRVVQVGKAWFHLAELTDKMEIQVEDADGFLQQRQRLGQTTEWLLLDLFDSQRMPALMYDMAFYRRCREVLAETGVLTANMLFTSEEAFLDVVGGLREVFGRRVLCLTVPDYRNVIVLAFAGQPAMHERKALLDQAQELQKETGMSYRPLVDRLFHINPNEGGKFVFL